MAGKAEMMTVGPDADAMQQREEGVLEGRGIPFIGEKAKSR